MELALSLPVSPESASMLLRDGKIALGECESGHVFKPSSKVRLADSAAVSVKRRPVLVRRVVPDLGADEAAKRVEGIGSVPSDDEVDCLKYRRMRGRVLAGADSPVELPISRVREVGVGDCTAKVRDRPSMPSA